MDLFSPHAITKTRQHHESSPYNVCINYIFLLKTYISFLWWTYVFFYFYGALLNLKSSPERNGFVIKWINLSIWKKVRYSFDVRFDKNLRKQLHSYAESTWMVTSQTLFITSMHMWADHRPALFSWCTGTSNLAMKYYTII